MASEAETNNGANAVASERQYEIVLDLSRLLSRILAPSPTGIDSVEFAYARGLVEDLQEHLSFSGRNPLFKRNGRLSPFWAKRYLIALEQRWAGGAKQGPIRTRIEAFWWLVALWPRPAPHARSKPPRIYLQVSPDHLDRPATIDAVLKAEGARFVCLVHDLIPIEFPEYAVPRGAERHERRLHTILTRADGIIANSVATRDAIQAYAAERQRPLCDIVVAALGTGVAEAGSALAAPSSTYFVCIGTIEPRKNHLLLLNIWRRMVESRQDGAVPHLVIIGRRGWENENIIDMLERCPALSGYVHEHNNLPNADVTRLLAGACALLLPSFAEGFGMPVAEALQCGVPVLCSNLPALREVAKDIAEYIDPLDGLGWIEAIVAYADPNSGRREAQLSRMTHWSAPTWREHLDIVQSFVQQVAQRSVG